MRDPDAVEKLMRRLRAYDPDTADHCEQTVVLAVSVAIRMGVDECEQRLIGRAARLHDIGKLGVPEALLRKPGPLDDDEQGVMRTHVLIGSSILLTEPELADLALAVRHEHERWDGTGYPDGIAGEAIPLASRIVLACDAWHAMTTLRPYRPPLDRETALAELQRGAGTQFDPAVVCALVELLTTNHGRPA